MCRVLQLPVGKELLRKSPCIHAFERRHGDNNHLRVGRIREIAAHLLNCCRVLGHQHLAKVRHTAEMRGLRGDPECRAEAFEPNAVLRTRLLRERDIRL